MSAVYFKVTRDIDGMVRFALFYYFWPHIRKTHFICDGCVDV